MRRHKIAMPISKVKAAAPRLAFEAVEKEFRRWLETNPLKIWKTINDETEMMIASVINVSQATVNYWIRGRVRPDMPSLGRLAKMMDEDPVELVKWWDAWWTKAPQVAQNMRMTKKKKHNLYFTEQGFWITENPLDKWIRESGAGHSATAMALGVTYNKLYRWLRGEGMPDLQTIAIAAKYMGTPWQALEAAWKKWIVANPYKRSGIATMRHMNKAERNLYARTGKTTSDIMEARERANRAGSQAAQRVRDMTAALKRPKRAD